MFLFSSIGSLLWEAKFLCYEILYCFIDISIFSESNAKFVLYLKQAYKLCDNGCSTTKVKMYH